MGTLLRQMRENLCSKNGKHYIEIWRDFVLSYRLALYFKKGLALALNVWKGLQPVWTKYHILNNKTFVVLLTDFDV